MAENRGTMGGFAAVNKPEGIIENCYCSTQLSGSQFVAGGFIGKNGGGITKSYCEEKTKKLSGNFAGTRQGKATDCYYVSETNTKDEEKDCIISSDVLRAKENCKKLGFDMNEIWEYAEQEPHLRFQPEKWMEQVEIKGQQVVHIKNMQDLMQFAESVNAGDRKSINAIVRLENNIDLKGQQWTPIGYKRMNAFAGLFDGNGYTIRNFVIRDDEVMQKGFFGYLKGSVCNLCVDCMIKGAGNIGALVATNEGIISCCGAVTEIHARGQELNVGGLVAVNAGRVYKSYVAGKVTGKALFVLPLAMTASAAVLAFGIWVVNPFHSAGANAVYQPIAADPGQTKSNVTYESDTQNAGAKHTLSFQFQEQLDVSLSTGECEINFVNPESDDYNIVVELQISDKDAIKLMGGTGRPEELQSALESADDYDPEKGRVTIAASGTVSPGYALEKLTMSNYSKIHLKSGEIKGYVVLVPFDPVTNDRAMVQSEMPVTINLID